MKLNRILIVEDMEMFREFLVSWFRREGYEGIWEAESLARAREISLEQDFDLVLLDLGLPDGDGVDYLEWQNARRPNTRVLVLTAHSERYPVLKLRRSHVMGMLDKGSVNPEELRLALAMIKEWRTYYSSRVEETFRHMVREGGAFYKMLSPREEDLVKRFGLGYSNEEIAQQLELSVSTIQGHRRNVMNKLNLKSTPEMMIWAVQNGFVRYADFSRRTVLF